MKQIREGKKKRRRREQKQKCRDPPHPSSLFILIIIIVLLITLSLSYATFMLYFYSSRFLPILMRPSFSACLTSSYPLRLAEFRSVHKRVFGEVGTPL